MTAARSTLLMLDFQQGTVDRHAGPDLLPAAQAALDAARQKEIAVIFVRLAFRTGYPEAAASNVALANIGKLGEAMTEGHQLSQIHTALAPQPHEAIVVKRRVSAFAGSDLDVLLRAIRAETLVLSGITTSGVVLSTLREAADLDYRITVLEDACADPDAEIHDMLMSRLFPRQASVVATREWVESLPRGA